MNHLKSLNKYLINEIKKTNEILINTRIARNNAPTAMESKSDTSRSKLENDVMIYELRLRELKQIVNLIPLEKKRSLTIDLWSFVEIQMGDKKIKLIIVTEEIGGIKINDIQCVSNKAPLGKILMGKKQTGNFCLNKIYGKILSVA